MNLEIQQEVKAVSSTMTSLPNDIYVKLTFFIYLGGKAEDSAFNTVIHFSFQQNFNL